MCWQFATATCSGKIAIGIVAAWDISFTAVSVVVIAPNDCIEDATNNASVVSKMCTDVVKRGWLEANDLANELRMLIAVIECQSDSY